ncbi:hypothetical protein BOO86_22080 [Mycobacterium sp. CBMA 234]|uniref:LysR family transcriptional regulator n=1 Tax=Mycolicibacterium sp. CBMA 234 TaxID=1918495 RepID=UPI001390CE9A|nr:LysR family transcriptional regulator [Mycolicibacterium sp. CBMA 234]MUL67179.1 hypothetical protein [Mycolicibacterium sp. CBMA 234]
MSMTHILRTDLNLIPALVALLDERHISRAAERVGLSQPAMSRALQRLRLALGDPLLVREPDGYRLTARAQALRGQLDAVIPLLEVVVSPETFEPGTSSQPIQLACTDFAALMWGRQVCQNLLDVAPSTTVRFHSWRYDTMAEQIRRGTIDIGLYGGYAPADLSTEELISDEFVCVVADDHPLAHQPQLTLDDYLRFGHIVIDVAEGVQPDIDYALQTRGAPRTAVITTPYHAVVPELLAGTELIATIPAVLARTWVTTHPISIARAPAEIGTMPYRMVWHPAFDDDARHRWIRAVLRATITAAA